MSGKIKKIKLIFNNIDITYNDGTIRSEIKIKQVEFGNLNVFNSGDRRDKINVNKIRNDYYYYTYNVDNDNNSGQTEYTLNIPNNTTADILLVAGGGGGGCRQVNSSYGSGGGGAGGLVFELNKKLSVGTYTIKVGKGGKGGSYQSDKGTYNENEKGKDTEIVYNSDYLLLAYGGGQGGNRNWGIGLEYQNIGKTGGSSGGSAPYYNYVSNSFILQPESVQTNTINNSYGNVGGNSSSYYPNYSGGGGGGAGSHGITDTINIQADGGNGLYKATINETDYNFKTLFKISDTTIGDHHTNGKVYFAGGGGGCRAYNNGGGNGGIGGGGNCEKSDTIQATNALNNTGGGGGGGRKLVASNGGSGIAIIRLKAEESDDTNLLKLIDNDNQSDYEIDLNNNILIFYLNNDIDRKDILNSLNQIILKTEKISQINNLNYDIILENDEDDEILFETINETSPNITIIDNYSEYKSRYFNVFTEERLYPPYIFRDLPLQTNNIFTISNRLYGNGDYKINYSSSEDTENNPLNIFNIFKNDFTSFTWKNNNYTNNSGLSLRDINSFSVYNKNENINSYNGDWISIKLPNKIILTKFILVIKDYNNVTINNLSKFPLEFKIFGKNNYLEDVWKEIIKIKIDKNELNNIYNDQYFINSYYTRLHTYNYEGTNDYKEYRLVIENDFFCDILIVGGGGAGGAGTRGLDRGGGGGGAGGLIYIKNIMLLSGTYNIIVGNGGQFSNHNGFKSSIIKSDNTTINYIAYGGGGGGNTGNRNNNTNGNGGGSGGGGADYNGSGGNSIDNNYGNSGGKANQVNDWKGGSGAGGGGYNSSGQDSNSNTKGLGGNGKKINISGEDIEYAKGGDGGRYDDGNGIDGQIGTGNGGNGAGRSQNRRGGKGGSGIVIIKQYSNYYNSYKHIFDENNKRLSGLEEFDEYALVINKIGGGTNADFGTWELYGKERFSQLNEVPTNIPLKRNIKFSYLNKVFNENISLTSNISIDDYKNYTPKNISNNLSFSTFKGLSIDSELPIKDSILARYIPNNIYMTFSEDNDIIGWDDIYGNYNITNINGSPLIQKITPNSNGLYTDNQRMTISTMKGTNDDIIHFPFTLRENYTFCYIARYTGNNNKRIFNSKNDRTYWCFNNDATCTSMYNNQIYSTTINQISDNDYWIIGIETGDSMRYNGMDCTNYIYDNIYSIDNSYEFVNTEDTNSITINGGVDDNNKGSWEIGELIFYNKKLSESEKIEIEEYFANRYYHISFTSIVQTIDDYNDIITNKYSINIDNDFYIWYNIYNGYKYAYSKLNSNIYGPANYLFDIKRFKNDDDVYYYWILFVDNTDNTNKFLEITIPNTEHNLYLIALGGGGSAGSYNNYTGNFTNGIISGPGNAGELGIFKTTNRNINNNILQIQVGHGGKMLDKVGSNGGDSKIISNNYVDIIYEANLYGCGYNSNGELGLGHYYHKNYLIENDYFNINNIIIKEVAVSYSNSHSLFLDQNGKVYSCGINNYGQLGIGNTTNKNIPTLINIDIDDNQMPIITKISTGDKYSLFLDQNRKVYSCGINNYGQLGISNTSTKYRPTLIPDFNNIIDISAGKEHSLFLDQYGIVYSCGRGSYGQLGLGINNTEYYSFPQEISNFVDINNNELSNPKIIKLSAGNNLSILLDNLGKVYSCGTNIYSQLGLGDTSSKFLPTFVDIYKDENGNILPLPNINDIKTGYFHSLFLANNGDVYSCGQVSFGQLGLGKPNTGTDYLTEYYEQINRPTLITIFNIGIDTIIDNKPVISKISAGYTHSLFLANNGDVYSCGGDSFDYYGHLGHDIIQEHSLYGGLEFLHYYTNKPTLITKIDNGDGTESNIPNNITHINAGYLNTIILSYNVLLSTPRTQETNGNKGIKGLDYGIYNSDDINGGAISKDLKTYLNDNSFSLDDILTDNYIYWNSDLIVDEQTESGKYYGYGAPGVITNNEYSGSSGVVAIIQSLEQFRNQITMTVSYGSSNNYNIGSYDNYEYHIFNHSGGSENQTEFQFSFDNNVTCDILIIGGGGGGGGCDTYGTPYPGGGGGAGKLIYISNIQLQQNTIYTVKIGNGGNGGSITNNYNYMIGYNGYDTQLTNNSTINCIAKGGGGGGAGSVNSARIKGKKGGSGGGNGASNNYNYTTYTIDGTMTIDNGTIESYGNIGGTGPINNNTWAGSGGGGGGSSGGNAGVNSIHGASGGNGKIYNLTNTNIEYAKGGKGGDYWGDYWGDDNRDGENGKGNGGIGGSRADGNRNGGKGGSGVVIIRYLKKIYLS